jgi:hypothetical protein
MKTLILFGTLLPIAVVFAGLRMNTVTLPRAKIQYPQPATGRSYVPATVAPVLERSCRDCHSNETVWPWYSHVPPMSLLVRHDVEQGRAVFNSSEWANGWARPTQNQLQEICDAVSDGSMPPKNYRMLHGQAALQLGDVDTLCKWAENAERGNVPPASGR